MLILSDVVPPEEPKASRLNTGLPSFPREAFVQVSIFRVPLEKWGNHVMLNFVADVAKWGNDAMLNWGF